LFARKASISIRVVSPLLFFASMHVIILAPVARRIRVYNRRRIRRIRVVS
jgi:hypothetical protein